MDEIQFALYSVAFNQLGDKELRMTQRQYQLHHQWRFLEVLREIPYYKNVIAADIRPLWRALRNAEHETPSIESVESDSPYARALDHLVRVRMNCRVLDEAADWVMEGVHADVIGLRTLPMTTPEPIHFVRGRLDLGVNSIGAAVLQRFTDEVNGEPRLVSHPRHAAFDDWDAFGAAAHAELDEVLNVMHQAYVQATSTFGPRRPSHLQDMRDERMRELISWLWPEVGGHVSLNRSTRQRLLRRLGLDEVKRARTRR